MQTGFQTWMIFGSAVIENRWEELLSGHFGFVFWLCAVPEQRSSVHAGAS